MCKSIKELLSKIKNNHSQLLSVLPKSTFGHDVSISKLPWKVEILKGVLLHRISDISGSSIKLIEESNNLQAIILIRASQESVAILHWLFLELDKVCITNEVADFDSIIMKLLFGSKLKPRKEEAFNVLKSIDKLTKLIPNFRESYEILSEFAHPNSAGTFIAYGQLDKEKNAFHFGSKARNEPIDNGLGALNGALLLTMKIKKDIDNIFSKFVQICENEINTTKQG